MRINKTRLFIVIGVLSASLLAGGALVAWRYRKNERADALIAAVKSSLEAGRFDNAKVESDKLVRLASQNADAHLLRAKALLAGRDPATIRTTDADALNAVRSLLSAVRVDSGHIESQRMILSYYLGRRNFVEGMQHAKEILRKTPEDSESRFTMARGLVQLNRPLEARMYIDQLMADEKPRIRPRTAALAAAVADAIGDDGKQYRQRAADALAGYMSDQSKFDNLDDRISLVELRCWKVHKNEVTAPVVREQLRLAAEELSSLVKDYKENDLLPGFVLDAVGQLLPDKKTWTGELSKVYTEVRTIVDQVTNETFNSAIERKLLDPRIYTAYADRLCEQSKDAKAVEVIRQGLSYAKEGSDLVKREFGSCDLWLAKHFLASKRMEDAKQHIDSLLAHPDWKPWGQLMQGYSLVLEDKFDAAAIPLRESMVRLSDSNGAVHALYGLCMLRRGYITQGREHLEKGKTLGADGPQFRAWLTLALAEAGETDAAIRMAQEVLGDEKTSGIGMALQGELRARIGDFATAERCLASALETADPKLRPAIRLSQAQIALGRKDWNAASKILAEIKQSKDYASRAFAIESRYHMQNREPEKAAAVLLEGRKLFPDNGLLLALQITDLTQAGRYDEARQILQAERTRSPDREQPYLLLAEVFEHARKPDEAITVLEEAAKRFTKESSIQVRLADKLISRGRTKEVGSILATLEGDPDVNPSTLSYLQARMADADGDFEKAGKIIEDAFKRDRYNPAIRFLKAQWDFKRANIADAQKELEGMQPVAGRMRPQNLTMLFATHLIEGNFAKASQLLADAEKTGTPEVVAPLRRRLVRLLAQQDRPAELEAEIATLLASKPSESDVALAVNVLQGIGQVDRARTVIKEALSRAPDSSVLNEVNVALMLDSKDLKGAQEEIARLFRKEEFTKSPTLHALRARGLVASADANPGKATEELQFALQAVEDGLQPGKCPGNPALVALKIQLLLRLSRDSDAASYANSVVKDADSKSAPGKYLLARAYENLGKIDKAFALLSEIVAADPADANAAHHYLRLLISRGQFGDLEPAIERFIAANAEREGKRENALLLGILGEYHATRGDTAKAAAVKRRLERIPNAGIVATYIRGVVAFAEGKLDDAEKALRLSTADPTGHIPSTFLLAQIRAQQGKFDESLKLLTRIAKSPESPAAVPLLRANLLLKTNRVDEAEQACRDYLKLNASARPFQQLLTQILMDRNTEASRAEALAMAEKAFAAGVENPLDFEVFLKVLFQADKTEKALTIITNEAVNKGKGELILAGGRACYAAGLFRDAERYAKRLVTDEPNHLNAKLLLGDCQMKLGADMPTSNQLERTDMLENAAKQYREVLQLQPGNVIAANNLAWVTGVHLNKPHRAIEELRNALGVALAVDNKSLAPEVLDTIGVIHRQMDHLTDAQAYLEEAANRKPTSAEIQLHLGELYQKQDRPDKAKMCFEKVRQLDRRGEFAEKLRALMR